MSCIWKIFSTKKEPLRPISRHSDLRISSPLNLDELPEDVASLEALEAAFMDSLTAIHYKLEESKENVKYLASKGFSPRLKEALAKRAFLTDRQRLLENRLQRVQARLTEMKASK